MSADPLDVPATGWDRRRERVAREIERAALTLFAKDGAAEVTVEQIAAAAGISPRTFFRYFDGRDDILPALPGRTLARISELVRARPPSEGLIAAFSAAVAESETIGDEGDLVLLWGIAMHRSPESALPALAQSSAAVTQVFQGAIAERLDLDPASARAGVLAAALAGLVGYTYSRWVNQGGTGSLAEMLTEGFDALADLLQTSD